MSQRSPGVIAATGIRRGSLLGQHDLVFVPFREKRRVARSKPVTVPLTRWYDCHVIDQLFQRFTRLVRTASVVLRVHGATIIAPISRNLEYVLDSKCLRIWRA